jgi:hypothetical protein
LANVRGTQIKFTSELQGRQCFTVVIDIAVRGAIAGLSRTTTRLVTSSESTTLSAEAV